VGAAMAGVTRMAPLGRLCACACVSVRACGVQLLRRATSAARRRRDERRRAERREERRMDGQRQQRRAQHDCSAAGVSSIPPLSLLAPAGPHLRLLLLRAEK